MRRRREIRRTLIAVALPALAYFLLFMVLPSLYSIRLALAPSSPEEGWVSLGNFSMLWSDPLFRRALLNNLVIPIGSVGIELAAGLGLALLLTLKFRGRGMARTVAILPFAIPEIVFLTVMKYIFTEHGYLNGVLKSMDISAIGWLYPETVLSVVVVMLADAWHVTPIVFLILLAALESIPPELYEAARTDGAGWWQCFRHITLPLLLPAMAVAVVLRGVDAMRIFSTPLVLTGVEGVPVLSTYAYHQWADYSNPGMANAAATLLALLVLSGSYFYLKLWHRGEDVMR